MHSQMGDPFCDHCERDRFQGLAMRSASLAKAPLTELGKSESKLSQARHISTANKHHSPCFHGALSKASLSGLGCWFCQMSGRGLAKKPGPEGLQFEIKSMKPCQILEILSCPML